MSARNEDFLFAQEAQALGYVSQEQVEEGFLLQRRMSEELKIEERLGVILVKRGWMAEEQARRVLGIVQPEGARGQIEGYRLVQMVGRGAMGTVYKAIHKGLHRVVAIKILRRDLAKDKTQVERLKREAKLLADLDHPNIVRAFDAGESNGFPYLVMEYVEGETLRDRIAREGALSDEEALRITRALADALERARRMGVVHRDVKPGNVLMSTSGTPKLMDLGLAKGPLDMGLTQHGATVGTPQFISPEQAQDPRKADTRSDIYSLGATLYAMVTTRPPFEGATLAEIITKVLYQQPVPPRMRNPAVSPEVGHLVERMMLKDPTLRYQTPAEVVADIDMVRGGQSIVPKGFTGNWEAYLLRQQQRRRQRWLSIGAAALLVLGVGTVLVLGRLDREHAQARVNELAARILTLDRVGPGDTLAGLRARETEASALYEEILQLEREDGAYCEDEKHIQAMLATFTENRTLLEKLERLRPWVQQQVDQAGFGEAHLRVEAYLESVDETHHLAPRRAGRELAAAVLAASDMHWKARQDAVLAATVRDLDEFVARWRDLREALEGDYVKASPAHAAALREADSLRAAALRILEEVRQVSDAYLGSAVAGRIRELQFFDLNHELSARRRDVRSAVEGHHKAFQNRVDLRELTGGNGFVTAALDAIKSALDRQVYDAWSTLKEEIGGGLDLDKALLSIEAFELAAARGNVYPRLAAEAAQLHASIDAEHSRLVAESRKAFAQTRSSVLEALRAGDPEQLRAAIDEALANQPLDGRRRAQVERMRSGAEALDRLYDAAMTHLATLPQERNVELRAPAGGPPLVDRRWTGMQVDRAARVISVKVAVPGTSRTQDATVPWQRLTLGQLLTWAEAGGQRLEPLHDAIVRLARLPPVHNDPGDLRPLVAEYGALAPLMDKVDPEGTWAGVVRHLHSVLRGSQDERDTLAQSAVTTLEWAVHGKDGQGPRYVLALQRIDALTDPRGKLFYTDVQAKNAHLLEKWAALCRHAIAQQELLRFVPGAALDVLEGGRHRFSFDFDDGLQLQNFERGLGDLEDYPGAAVTPHGGASRRLHLLRGTEGLVRDRPLSIASMFDPHDRIVVSFRMDTLRGSFLVAFDVDGVQLAVCSADPNWWKWRLRSDAPLLADETKLPDYDFYGRGRGIAYHAGPDFGTDFPLGNWDWPSYSAGQNFERWLDPDWIAKRDDMFAFEPGREYRVQIVRTRGEMQLWVDGQVVAQRHDPAWATRGRKSELEPRLTRGGSGRIQILTWTPLAIDDLAIEGRILDEWREARKKELEGRK